MAASNLRPEQRVDKNGKTSIRHVRTDPRRSSSPAAPLPAPKLAAPKKTRADRAYQPTDHQLRQRQRFHDIRESPVDPVFAHEAQVSNFDANDVETYEVLAATTNVGDALHLLAQGVRTFDDAHEYLREHDAEHLIADRRELTDRALENDIPVLTFLTPTGTMRKYANSHTIIDLSLFSRSPLSKGQNVQVISKIADGSISFADIKAVGVTLLKQKHALYHFAGAFEKLNSGTADYTTEDIKYLVRRALKEMPDEWNLPNAPELLDFPGTEFLRRYRNLRRIVAVAREGRLEAQRWGENDTERIRERVAYTLTVTEALPWFDDNDSTFYYAAAYFDAGIPVQLAIDVISNDGTVTQAKAIQEGITPSVSEGWL